MRFWIREILGWALVLLGLAVFWICFLMLVSRPPLLLQAGMLTFIGFILFRGGLHLLKVAVAARICLHAERQIERQKHKPPVGMAPPAEITGRDW
jgi:hypothetical protein